MRRRSLLRMGLGAALLEMLPANAGASGGDPAQKWLAGMVGLKNALKAGHVTETAWQNEIESSYATAPIAEIVRTLNIDRLAARFSYATRLADFADPALPPEIIGVTGMNGWFFRVFGMRRGGGLLPHVHNNMVSAHLVISGSFHIRTHDRIRDLDDAVVLRPVRDEVLYPGAVLTMGDARENQHWLRALEDRSMTLDIGIYDVGEARPHLPAQFNSTILVDPTVRPERDGTIVAPVLSFQQSAAKFA